MTTQTHEILAWLGDDHHLTPAQVSELTATATAIEARYPDDQDRREVALTVAYRLMVGEAGVVEELAAALLAARLAEARALAGLRQAAVSLVPAQETQAGFARRAGVDRMAVRGWLGQR